MENKALAVIEIKTISKGYVICDNLLKLNAVKLVMAQSVCPGKFIILLGGDVSSVENAVDYVKKNYGTNVIDVASFAQISNAVYQSVIGVYKCERGSSVGILETFSISALIRATDVAVKSTGVDILEMRIARGLGGKSYAILTGSVSNVNMAVENGIKVAQESGMLVDGQVIPSPHADLWEFI